MRGDLQLRSVWVPIAILSVGALLRFAAARGDLWLDEIWSIDIAREAGSLLGVLATRHDNNHPHNTIWLLAAGGSGSALDSAAKHRLVSTMNAVEHPEGDHHRRSHAVVSASTRSSFVSRPRSPRAMRLPRSSSNR